MCPKWFLKITEKPNNHQFDLPNFLKFCGNISHKLLRPSQSLENILEILEWKFHHFAEINQHPPTTQQLLPPSPLPTLLNVAVCWERVASPKPVPIKITLIIRGWEGGQEEGGRLVSELWYSKLVWICKIQWCC